MIAWAEAAADEPNQRAAEKALAANVLAKL
jgi:hypothetical protein